VEGVALDCVEAAGRAAAGVGQGGGPVDEGARDEVGGVWE
jgi:hypothetical protein